MRVKGQTTTLDDLDWKILQALQENARGTYTEIGRQLGITHSTVYERVKRMEKHGIIRKYAVVIDPEKADLRRVTAFMTVITDPKESEKVAAKLSEFEEVLEVFASLSEELSIIAKVVAENQDKLHSFIAQSVAPLRGVLRIRTQIVTKKHKEQGFLIKRS